MKTIKAYAAVHAAFLTVLFLMQPAAVQAGGLFVSEFGTPSQGASNAGAGVLAEDASTAFQNPAGIMQLENSEWMATGMAIFSSVEFDQSPGTTVGADGDPTPGSGSDGGDAGGFAAGMAGFYANPFSEKWGAGVSLISYSAAILDYEPRSDFVGRYWATKVDLLTLGVTPTIARRLSDSVTIAIAVPILWGSLDLDVAVPAPVAGIADGRAKISDGTDWSATGSVSALFEIGDRSRIGVTWLGKNEVNFDSDLAIELPAGGPEISDINAEVEIPYAQTVRLSASRDVNDRITLLGTLAWEEWSTLDNVLISVGAGSGDLVRDWDDTWSYRFGVRGRTDGPWTWYTGAAYDTSATSDSKRTADMPVDRQIRLSGGATYKKSEKTTLGGVLTYLDLGDGGINNGGTRPISGEAWNVNGDYGTNRVVFLGFNAGWK